MALLFCPGTAVQMRRAFYVVIYALKQHLDTPRIRAYVETLNSREKMENGDVQKFNCTCN